MENLESVSKNLMSVSALLNKNPNAAVFFYNDSALIVENGKDITTTDEFKQSMNILLEAKEVDGLYIVDEINSQKESRHTCRSRIMAR